MYRFSSSLSKDKLEKKYKDIYIKAKLQDKWDNEVAKCSDLASTIPTGKTPVDLLTMSYEELVDVYLHYQSVYNGLPADRQTALKEAAQRVFTYDSYKGPISKFLGNKENGFKIYNCVYCDLVDARVLDNGKRQFKTEHILDRGKCPLVGLSLYNFCPSCDFCNTNCKHSQPIGNGALQMKKLGPTSKQYDFEHKVKFVLNKHSEALGRIKYDHLEWYDIRFAYKDDDYKEVVKLFELERRYNEKPNKLLALEWREKAEKNKGISIAITAFLHGNTIEEERNRILHLNEYREAHSLGLKLMEDMVNV